LGVSFDTPEANRAWAEKNRLPFKLLSDRDHALADAVGAARALIPIAKRISYLVGRDGVILETYAKVDPATHAEEVLADLERLGIGLPVAD
jgi:peroxiredoxin Q/BCP